MSDQSMPKIESNESNLMKELSDIKSSLAVNTNETQNIKSVVGEIKIDLRSIRDDYITRREFGESLGTLQDQLTPIKRLMYGLMTAIGLTILGALFKLILK